ncbi:MAG: LytTR family transcriptional regulator [Cellulosilyticum sp.]|nr:LytTR family transcriptional regulator [Cellulosilyticum sp.]
MKIIIEDALEGAEDEIIIRCHELDEHLLELIYGMKTNKSKLCCSYNGAIYMVNPQDLYYFEAVDNKVFAYGEQMVYEVKYKLYELEELFGHTEFFRASKSSIVNLSKMVKVVPSFNGRFEALLSNGEKVIVSRQFVPELKKKLGI